MKTILALLSALSWLSGAQASDVTGEQAWKTLAQPGRIVLFRHAIAPGGGDPPGFVLGNCATQRNLSEEGRAQARAIGTQFAKHGIRIARIGHSQWCRTQETAQLIAKSAAYKQPLQAMPMFNSFFGDYSKEPGQTAQAKELLSSWQRSEQAQRGVLIVVTHQVNITALTEITPQSGEGVVLGVGLKVLGRVLP